MKVTPSSATCETWSLLMSMNCGMNAPKNTSTLGFESSTTKPCRKNPPRGGGGGALAQAIGDHQRHDRASQQRQRDAGGEKGEIDLKGHERTRGCLKRQFDYARSYRTGEAASLPLSPCGRGWLREAKTGEGSRSIVGKRPLIRHGLRIADARHRRPFSRTAAEGRLWPPSPTRGDFAPH